MAVLFSLSYLFFMVLGLGLAASPAAKTIVDQQIGAKMAPPAHKKVTVGDPSSTVAIMNGGGPPDYVIHDTVRKVVPTQPDSHRIIDDHYKKSTTVREHLKTPAKGTNEGHIQIDRQVNSAQVRDIVHKGGRTVTTTKGEHHRDAQVGLHRQITEANRHVHTDVFNSCEACDKTSRSVNEGKDSALMKSREDKGEFTTHYLESETKIHDKNHTDNKGQQAMFFKHETQQTTGTMQTVHDSKDNLMMGAMHDVHTETITGHHDAQTATNEQETPLGKIKKKKSLKRENIAAADVQEHYMNAYHETPLHKFIMNNKQVRDDRFRQESVDAHYDTELKRKDGVKVEAHVEKKSNLDASRLQHLDELRIKTIPKAHPDQLTDVRLRTRIVDRDHLLVNQHQARNTITTMPDGGKRTMSVKEDRVVSKDLKTTPTDKRHVDHTLPIAEQVHMVEKTVVPADKEVMTPLVHHYHIKRIE